MCTYLDTVSKSYLHFLLGSGSPSDFSNVERVDQPEEKIIFGKLKWSGQPENKEDDLDAADDGKSSEKPHGASDET